MPEQAHTGKRYSYIEGEPMSIAQQAQLAIAHDKLKQTTGASKYCKQSKYPFALMQPGDELVVESANATQNNMLRVVNSFVSTRNLNWRFKTERIANGIVLVIRIF
jgi:hypothetical protein